MGRSEHISFISIHILFTNIIDAWLIAGPFDSIDFMIFVVEFEEPFALSDDGHTCFRANWYIGLHFDEWKLMGVINEFAIDVWLVEVDPFDLGLLGFFIFLPVKHIIDFFVHFYVYLIIMMINHCFSCLAAFCTSASASFLFLSTSRSMFLSQSFLCSVRIFITFNLMLGMGSHT